MRTNADESNNGTSDVTTSLTLRQAAVYLNVHDETIRRWIKGGRLPAIKVGIAGHYRVRQADLDKMVSAA